MKVLGHGRLVLALGVLGVVFSTLGFVAPVLAIAGAVLAVLVLIYQHLTSGAVVVPFTAADWTWQGDQNVMEVPKGRHGKRAPSVTVWLPTDDGSYEEVHCGVETKGGDIRVSIGGAEPLTGELRIS